MTATLPQRGALPAALEQPSVSAAFQLTAGERAVAVAMRTPGGVVELSWRDYAHLVRRTATGLHACGVRRGDVVAFMLANRPEFHVVDCAAIHLGAAGCSIYNTSAPEQVAYVLRDAGAVVLVTEVAYLDVVRAAIAALEQPPLVVVLDADDADDLTLHALQTLPAPGFDFEASWRAVEASDVLALVYTSGTTGPPKGVELTHGAALAIGRSFLEVVPLSPASRVISYLPMAHVAERCCSHWLPMVLGFEVTCCPEPLGVLALLPEVRPQWFFSVPRVWEKLKVALEAYIGSVHGEERFALDRAFALGLAAQRARAAGEPLTDRLRAELASLETEVLAPLRARFGLDQIGLAHVGAAPTPLAVLEFFAALGLPVGEIWGMTELGAACCVSPPGSFRPGTVGPALPGVALRVAPDGEILVRSPAVMRGYRGRPAETRAVLDEEGWLATGDIGTLDPDGYLRIVDRKKELIITAAGKNIAPALVEARLRSASPLVDQACVIGDGRPYLVALLSVEHALLSWWAQDHGLDGAGLEALLAHPAFRAAIERSVTEANAGLARPEQVKRFAVCPEAWRPSGDELTPTMKLKRRAIAAKYAAVIDDLYATGG